MDELSFTDAEIKWCRELLAHLNTTQYIHSWNKFIANCNHEVQLKIETEGWSARTVYILHIHSKFKDIDSLLAFLSSDEVLRLERDNLAIDIDELIARFG